MAAIYVNFKNTMENERNAWGDALVSQKSEPSSKGPVPGTQALWKGLSILKLIASSQEPLRFSDLLSLSGLPKGTLHRILQALIDFRFVRLEDNDQTYRLGTHLFEMAHKVWDEFDLRGAAEPELWRLKEFSNETCRLGVFDENSVLVIDQIETLHPLRMGLGVGKRLQLHASAMGKAIFAHLPPAELNETLKSLELSQLTSNTIQDPDEFLRHLDLTKARGYAISIEEQFHGINSVAAPILDHMGKPLGAISITGGAYRLTHDELHSLGREVIESSRRISGNVGATNMSIAVKRKPKVTHSTPWKCAISTQAFLGEGPHWNAKEKRLEWVDILEPSAHVSDPETGDNQSIKLPEILGAMVPRRRGGHIAVTQFGYRTVDLATGKMTPFATPENLSGRRFNDGKCDAKGRFWAGTLALDASPGQGELYCLEENGELRKVLDGLDISNGLGWNSDNTKMYLTDSGKRTIYEMDYDLASGTISNQRIFAQLNEEDGSPDGLAVDCEGGVWSAMWDGWRVIRFDAKGVIDRVIELPVPRPTSCAFGGPNMTTLYITSARIRLSSSLLAEAPLSGSVFAIETGIQGVEVSDFAG